MIEIVGWIGSMLLAFSGLPELIRSIINGRCDLGWGLLFCWYVGEWLVLFYAIKKDKQVNLRPLLLNYGFNILFISGLIYIKIMN